MPTIEETLKALYGNDYNDQDIKRLSRKIDALKIQKIDELTSLLAIIDYDVGLMDKVPNKIKSTTNELIYKIKQTTNSVVNEVEQIAIKNATEHINKISAETTMKLADAVRLVSVEQHREQIQQQKTVEKRKVILYTAISVTLFIISLCFSSLFFYYHGKTNGIEIGKIESKNDELLLKKRDAFVQTKFFKVMFEMYESGELQEILYCQKRGWRKDTENGICIPGSYVEDGQKYTYGWRLFK